MGENTLYKRFLPLVILTVGILLQGCKDDVFNPEKVKAAYQDRFPVKNIDPAMETVTEDFQNFSQRFSGADFCCRQTTASCTFVCRKTFRHTKGARSARLGGVPESRHLNYQTDDNHEKEDRTPDNDRSQSPQV